MMQVILSNSKHPEYGRATIPFPLAQDQYEDCVELLEKLEIGDVMERDCKVEEIQGGLPILKRLEKVAINIDELDYLAKRLDSFDSITSSWRSPSMLSSGTLCVDRAFINAATNATYCRSRRRTTRRNSSERQVAGDGCPCRGTGKGRCCRTLR